VASVEQTLQIRSSRPLRLVLALAWTALILALCLTPSQWLPRSESDGSPFRIPHLDKVLHATMFAGFGLLWSWAVASRKRWAGVLIAGALLAVGTEVLQGLPIVHRDGDFFDGLADLLGTVLGVGTILLGGFLSRPDDRR
jgi:hypothetical protein